MPIKTIRTMTCDLCQQAAELELLPKLPPPGDWLIMKLKSGKDGREKVEVAICPACTECLRVSLPVPSVGKDSQADIDRRDLAAVNTPDLYGKGE